MQADKLREKGLYLFDAWASTFGETTTAMELAPEGYNYSRHIFSVFENEKARNKTEQKERNGNAKKHCKIKDYGTLRTTVAR